MSGHRGTTNGNVRGSVEDRRRRRAWLIETYRADRDVACITVSGSDLPATVMELPYATDLGTGVPACRCYRCGLLLTMATVTVDRIRPGCQGGTYRRENIRPACGTCNSSTGGRTRRK